MYNSISCQQKDWYSVKVMNTSLQAHSQCTGSNNRTFIVTYVLCRLTLAKNYKIHRFNNRHMFMDVGREVQHKSWHSQKIMKCIRVSKTRT